MKHLLLDALSALKTIPTLKTISEDWGQLDFYETRPAVNFPCALVDLSIIEHVAEKGSSTNPGTFVIRVADARLTTANANAPAEKQEAAFAILDLVNDIADKINGMTGESYRAVRRIITRKNTREDGIREYQITFTCKLR